MRPAIAPGITKAILPVWLGGTPPDLHAIRLLSKDVTLIEDACQAVGASLDNEPSGTWGDAAAFSFHPLKPLLVWGDGGAVALPQGADTWLRNYRDHGKVSRDQIVLWGINARMQTLQCVVALRGMDHVADAVIRRQHIADFLDKWLGEIPGITDSGAAREILVEIVCHRSGGSRQAEGVS